LLKRYLVLPAVLIASALAFAACGSSGSSDEGQITEAIQTSATGSDPANCTKLSTQSFMEQSSQTEGKEAVKMCEEEVKNPEDRAESVAVSNVEVEGEEATAEAAVTGGGFDGQALDIALVKEGGQWKLNEISGFAKLDKAKLVESLEKSIEGSSGELSEETGSCIVEGFEEATQPEIEEFVLSSSPEAIEELAKECS
jgi:hypothetical protein